MEQWACVLVRDLQLHAAVDDIGFQTVQLDDLRVAVSFAEVLHGNVPQGIPVNNGMYTVGFGGFSIDERQIGHLHRGHNGVFDVLALVDDCTVAGYAMNIPVLRFDPGWNRLSAVILRAGDFHKVACLNSSRYGGFRGFGRLCTAAQSLRNL